MSGTGSIFFFSSRRRHTRYWRDWSSDVCSSDLYCRNPEETSLPLPAQALERWYHVLEHLSDAQCRSASCLGNRIVQVKDVDLVKTQSCQAAFERHGYGVGNAAELTGR